MSTNGFTVRSHIAAPIEIVWERITDHEGMAEWSALKNVTLEQEGTPERNGLGAIRAMASFGPTIREEVTEWNPPSSYSYALRSKGPIRDHLGTVSLRQVGNRTEVKWSVRFRSSVPGLGWVISKGLKQAITGMLDRLRNLIESSST